MKENPITQDHLEELDSTFEPFSEPNKSMFEIVSTKGKQIVAIGDHVEAWSLGNICFIYEDKEYVGGFHHTDEYDYGN